MANRQTIGKALNDMALFWLEEGDSDFIAAFIKEIDDNVSIVSIA